MAARRPRRLTAWKLALPLCVACFSAVVQQAGAVAGQAARPGELIVRFEQGTTPSEERAAVEDAGARLDSRLKLIDGALVKVDRGRSGDRVERLLEQSDEVAYAEPNYKVKAYRTPNDPSFSSQWGLSNTGQSGGSAGVDIGALTAWDALISTSVTVAVLDTGVSYSHSDLSGNMWHNSGEVPSNSADDEGDSYVDDYYGVDTVNGDGDPVDDYAPVYHGTHVAGIVGASGNNGVGISGVAWSVPLMAVKVLDSSGNGSDAAVIAGVAYARAHGARVINASFGGPSYSQAFSDAIASFGASGGVFVTAAGNGGDDHVGDNNDAVPDYPSSYPLTNIVSVAALTRQGARASFSNYGPTTVDLAAPGAEIISTLSGSSYATYSGTSMAAPHVAGAAALYLQAHPEATASQVRQALIQSATPVSAFSGLTVSGGRLNLSGLLGISPPSASASPSPPVPSSDSPQPAAPAQTTLKDSGLKLTKTRKRGRKVRLSGAVAQVDGGSLSVSTTVKSTRTARKGDRTVRRRTTKTIRARKVTFDRSTGTWSAELKLPRPGTYAVEITFSGTSQFAGKTLTERVKIR